MTLTKMLQAALDEDLTSGQLQRRIAKRSKPWIDQPDELDLEDSHRKLQNGRRYIQRSLPVIERMLSTVLNVGMDSTRLLPAKLVNEMRAGQEAFEELEAKLYEERCGMSEIFEHYAFNAEQVRKPPRPPKMTPEQKKNWKLHEEMIARGWARLAQEEQEKLAATQQQERQEQERQQE